MNFDSLPDDIRVALEPAWLEFASVNPELAAQIESHTSIALSLPKILACSLFVRRHCLRDSRFLNYLLNQPQPLKEHPFDPAGFEKQLSADLDGMHQQHDSVVMQVLRAHRNKAMALIAWRDLAGVDDVGQTLVSLSSIADALVQHAVRIAELGLQQRFGVPRSASGESQSLIVLGMGKLGGRELNFSSDIDLVFLYPHGGQTDGPRSLDNAQFFQRVCQKVIRLLDQVTADGFVFRVDARLRPFGASGPLTVSFAAFENYLAAHGREWERYAYIKSRPITGDSKSLGELEQTLRPFVYRRYLDYGVFESIREMRRSIIREHKSHLLEHNIKLGAGGIREIEFIVQTFQLIRGGADKRLRGRELLPTLSALAGAGVISSEDEERLSAAYRFHRMVENRIQMQDDRQTHLIPKDGPELQMLALSMDRTESELKQQIQLYRDTVSSYFDGLVVGSSENEELESQGDSIAYEASLQHQLDAFKAGSHYLRMDKHGRQRLDKLLPRVAALCQQTSHPDVALERLLHVLQAIGRRSAYFSLMLENQAALERLVKLCVRAKYISDRVAKHPVLLDELIDHRRHIHKFDADFLWTELNRRLDEVEIEDQERRMDIMRQFHHAAKFRIALDDMDGLPIEQVSDRLSDLAETLLKSVRSIAWGQAVASYGKPRSGAKVNQFAIVAYGKLGGYELGYDSDLDLVFLHDSNLVSDKTDGKKTIDNARFFARLSQRIMHLLQVPTAAGRLYEVDTRLRPSGRSGLLVSSLDAFSHYQKKDAWTWEHQSLLRARAVTGDPDLCQRFESARREILCLDRDCDQLRQDVVAMRKKMRQENAPAAGFHLKQDPGGMTDIEFLIQYLVLRWAREHPALLQVTDNLRWLEGLAEAGVMDPSDAQQLARCYLALRQRVHHNSLDGRGVRVDDTEFADQRRLVRQLWDKFMI